MMTFMSRLGALILTLGLVCPASVHAARVIMKDGRIFEGKIVAETDGDVLIKTSPVNRPKLLPADAILTVVRDPVTPEPHDPQRYVSLGLRLMGNFFSTQHISLDPSAGLALDGSLRFHPLIEIGAAGEWTPQQSGDLSVSDGTTTREYQSFFSYGGSLWARAYPFYRKTTKVEPFLMMGYRWSNIIPKDSGDALKGGGIFGGIGAHWPLGQFFFLDAGLLYHHDSYGVIEFNNIDGSVDPRIQADSYSLMTGVSYHL